MPRITGQVVERYTQRPVKGAMVRADGFVAITDRMGRFNMESTYGTVSFSVTHRDFHPLQMPLNVVASQNLGTIRIESRVVAL